MRCTYGKDWNAEQGRCTGQAQPLRWQAALQEVQAINHPGSRHRLHQFAGVKQWRMPNIKELSSLTEQACFAPAANETAFASGLVTEVATMPLIYGVIPRVLSVKKLGRGMPLTARFMRTRFTLMRWGCSLWRMSNRHAYFCCPHLA